MILDSCFLIDLLAEDGAAVAKLDEIADRLLSVPTLVYTEVGFGIGPGTSEAGRFEEVMGQANLVSYDDEAARRAVDIHRQLLPRGEGIGAVDTMIAGTALARDEPVVTRNVDEFSATPARVSPY